MVATPGNTNDRAPGRPLPRMSASVEDLQGHFPIVVIGTRYGGHHRVAAFGAGTAGLHSRTRSRVSSRRVPRLRSRGARGDAVAFRGRPRGPAHLALRPATLRRRQRPAGLRPWRHLADQRQRIRCRPTHGCSRTRGGLDEVKSDLETALARGYARATAMLGPNPPPTATTP